MTDIHAEQRIDLLVDHDVDKIKKKIKIHIAPGMRKTHKKGCDSIEA
jgi:RNase P subunit RPR2